MNYREKRALFIALEDAMQQGDPAGALHAADALYAAGPTERRCWEAVLAAYIDGGEKERALTAAAAYSPRGCRRSLLPLPKTIIDLPRRSTLRIFRPTHSLTRSPPP